MITLIEIRNGPDERRNGIVIVKDRKKRRCAMVAEIKDNIADNLAGRSEAELRDIVSRANFLLGNSQNDGQTVTTPEKVRGKDDSDALSDAHAAFSEALKSSEGGRSIPLAFVLRSGYGARFRKVATAMSRLIREDFKATLPVERLKIARLVVGLAAGELEQQGITVSLRTLCDRLKNPNAVVDRAFPFYRASGLLPMIVKRKNVK